MWTITFIVLAAVSKAVADTLAHHFNRSVFKRLPKRWWKYIDPGISWNAVGFIRFTKYRPDAWHLANSLMIMSFVLAVVFDNLDWHWSGKVGVLGLVFIWTFNLFYDNLLLQKPK